MKLHSKTPIRLLKRNAAHAPYRSAAFTPLPSSPAKNLPIVAQRAVKRRERRAPDALVCCVCQVARESLRVRTFCKSKQPSLAREETRGAFTRIELLALTLALLLLALVSLPLIANTPRINLGVRERSNRIVCLANLRQIGQAFQVWASDHGDQNPSFVRTNAGGIYGVPLANNCWYHFAWVSNELVTPRVLVCPSDTSTTRVAQDFSSSPDGGFLNAGYRNNALSYLLSLHSFFYSPSILSGDRNIQPFLSGQSCQYSGLSAVLNLERRPVPLAEWNNEVHGSTGNLLFNDGSAQESSVADLRNALLPEGGTSSLHILMPR